jgi:hypothetical protein
MENIESKNIQIPRLKLKLYFNFLLVKLPTPIIANRIFCYYSSLRLFHLAIIFLD